MGCLIRQVDKWIRGGGGLQERFAWVGMACGRREKKVSADTDEVEAE